jgi:hypothetical protein
MIDYENIIRTVTAFASEKMWKKFEELAKNDPDVDKIYSELIVNKGVSYLDVISMINKFEKSLPKGFKEEFVEYHKNFKKKKDTIKSGEIVAKVDKFHIINTYSGMTQDSAFKSFRGAIELIQQAVDELKKHGFDSVIYGDIFLRDPRNRNSIATYNPDKDEIELKLYKEYSGHALPAIIHEIAHRVWYKLMNYKDEELWVNEYNDKMNHVYKGKFPEFPSNYSKTNVKEYFAVVIEEYIMSGKKYSELIDLIV